MKIGIQFFKAACISIAVGVIALYKSPVEPQLIGALLIVLGGIFVAGALIFGNKDFEV